MNVIEDMRARLQEQFVGRKKPPKGYDVSSVFRPTANDMPRKPQSNIPTPRPRYDNAGRPAKRNSTGLPTEPTYRKKPKDIFGGWL